MIAAMMPPFGFMLRGMNEKRGYQRLLLVIGLGLLVFGVITWIVAANNMGPATWYGDEQGLLGALIWMWVGIGACILGVLLVLALVIIRAASGSPEVEGPERLSLSQTRRRQAEQQSR